MGVGRLSSCCREDPIVKPLVFNKPDLIAGRLYKCKTSHGAIRVCRFGYHRANNINNWSDPPEGERKPSMVWYGWRDDGNFRFLRPEEVLSYEIMEKVVAQTA